MVRVGYARLLMDEMEVEDMEEFECNWVLLGLVAMLTLLSKATNRISGPLSKQVKYYCIAMAWGMWSPCTAG